MRGVDVGEALRAITTKDVRDACDVLRPVYDASDGVDGRVSIEVDPRISGSAEKTIAEARALWWLVDRPNLFIKIPATMGSLPAISQVAVRGHQRQRHADLQPGALRPRDGRVPRGHGAGAEVRHRPVAHRLGRLVLRQPGRHRDRQAARQDRHEGRQGAARQGRRRQRAAGLPALREHDRGRPLEGAGRRRRQDPAPALGLDRREGPELPRHAVRGPSSSPPTRSTPCRKPP